MQLTTALFALSAAASVSAHPSIRHGHHHMRKDAGFYAASRPAGSDNADAGGQVKAQAEPTVETPETSTSAAAATTSTTSSSSGGSGSAQSFPCTNKRATTADIFYGTVYTPYGCNWMEIADGDADAYDYSMTFKANGADMTCQCWNKLGSDGGVNGMWEDMLKLSIPKGSTKSVAIMENTQGACGCAEGSSVPKSGAGMWLGTWVELDMGNTRAENARPDGSPNCGADVSTLAVQDTDGGDFIGMKLTVHEKETGTSNTCSAITANAGKILAAYVVGAEANIHAADGIGCKDYGPNNLYVELGDVSW